jgi:hypothetical protein
VTGVQTSLPIYTPLPPAGPFLIRGPSIEPLMTHGHNNKQSKAVPTTRPTTNPTSLPTRKG